MKGGGEGKKRETDGGLYRQMGAYTNRRTLLSPKPQSLNLKA